MHISLPDLYQVFQETQKVCTDTRKIVPGSIFFALRGPNFNANAFAEEALEKGAQYAVVDEPAFDTSARTLRVANVLASLQALAHHHRQQLTIPIVGLTGSNGKTTSKELVSAVLRKKFNTFATQGNLNNHIGVPLSILSVTDQHELAVIEMGANHVGEIAALAAIANPTHGFITNIGKAHIGTFGGFENIIRGKSELYQHLIQHRGQVFINSQNHILANMAKRFTNPLFYPAKGDFYHCELLEADPFVTIKTETGATVRTQMVGTYNFENIAVALCLGKYFGVEVQAANEAVVQYVPGNMRSQIIKKNSNTIILDAYNANPSSMEAAIENLGAMPAARKVAILGDMYELEGEAEAEHRHLGELLVQHNIHEVYLCGELIRAAQQTFPKARYFNTKTALTEALQKDSLRERLILVKASRGMRLEDVLEVI